MRVVMTRKILYRVWTFGSPQHRKILPAEVLGVAPVLQELWELLESLAPHLPAQVRDITLRLEKYEASDRENQALLQVDQVYSAYKSAQLACFQVKIRATADHSLPELEQRARSSMPRLMAAGKLTIEGVSPFL